MTPPDARAGSPTHDKRSLTMAAADVAARYVTTERDGSVSPSAVDIALLEMVEGIDLDAPLSAQAAIALLDELGAATMKSTGGRYFGFVNGGVQPMGLAAAIVSGAWDQNVALPAMSPVTARLDRRAASWVIELLGLPAESTAAFCGGATVANITAIVAARDALLERAGWDVQTRGLVGAPALRVVASDEIHVSVLKAIRIAGLGTDSVDFVPTDGSGRIRPELMPVVREPTLVLLQAGNVNTGHSDPFAEIIPALDRKLTWIHVDGAFGLWANAAPGRAHINAGVALADSWATDAHKWLNSPYDSGLVIVRDGSRLLHSMRMDAAYVPADLGERALMNLGLQMSQAARAVPTWAIIATEGRRGIADAIERCCKHASRFAVALAEGGATILAPVVLNQALIAFGDDATTDAVIEAIQDDGTCWVGGTTWQGQRAMRISVSDVSTTTDDIDRSADAILHCWHGLEN